MHLKGKPAPDTFLAGARGLAVEPGRDNTLFVVGGLFFP
jgi:hypothetical protein